VASDEAQNGRDSAHSTSEYVRSHRVASGLSIEQLAARVDVDPGWLAAFEAGERVEELTYDLLLRLVRATEPPRPEWWDDGHEHDLHLPAGAEGVGGARHSDYWRRVAAVRAESRCPGGDGR
jgi:hypothetical protein